MTAHGRRLCECCAPAFVATYQDAKSGLRSMLAHVEWIAYRDACRAMGMVPLGKNDQPLETNNGDKQR